MPWSSSTTRQGLWLDAGGADEDTSLLLLLSRFNGIVVRYALEEEQSFSVCLGNVPADRQEHILNGILLVCGME